MAEGTSGTYPRYRRRTTSHLKRILYVAYPLATVSEESCGGAEQMLFVLEREMAARGHLTWVAACTHSHVSGQLVETGAPAIRFDQLEERDAEHNAHVVRFIREMRACGTPIDVVHDQGGRFWRQAREIDVPVLATLNLPRSFYGDEAFETIPENVYFNCVSHTQVRSFGDVQPMLDVIPNGMPLERFPFRSTKGDYLVWLGRICEEKGAHIAIEVADRAGMQLVIMGPSYLYARDKEYFDACVAPRFGANVEFIGSPSFQQKVAILGNARALLMPSLLPETSSLVSIEAMACGTPVIAFRNGALAEVILDGMTGYIVDSAEEMVEAIPRLGKVRPAACRIHVERNHTATSMASHYEQLYAALADPVAAPSITVGGLKFATATNAT